MSGKNILLRVCPEMQLRSRIDCLDHIFILLPSLFYIFVGVSLLKIHKLSGDNNSVAFGKLHIKLLLVNCAVGGGSMSKF